MKRSYGYQVTRGEVQLTLDGSSPIIPGVQPSPEPSARLTRFLITVVLPEQGGPTTITLGPRPGPALAYPVEGAPLPSPFAAVERRERIRKRSRAR